MSGIWSCQFLVFAKNCATFNFGKYLPSWEFSSAKFSCRSMFFTNSAHNICQLQIRLPSFETWQPSLKLAVVFQHEETWTFKWTLEGKYFAQSTQMKKKNKEIHRKSFLFSISSHKNHFPSPNAIVVHPMDYFPGRHQKSQVPYHSRNSISCNTWKILFLLFFYSNAVLCSQRNTLSIVYHAILRSVPPHPLSKIGLK